jgi:hypothetical protein
MSEGFDTVAHKMHVLRFVEICSGHEGHDLRVHRLVLELLCQVVVQDEYMGRNMN